MFADDTNISTNGKTNDELQERINVDLENVHQWLLANKLTLNKDKTEYMIIGSRQRISNLVTDPEIELGESVIKRVHKSKNLGVIIDEHLLWNHPTSFPGLQCEDEARHEEALVWAGHVTTKNGSI